MSASPHGEMRAAVWRERWKRGMMRIRSLTKIVAAATLAGAGLCLAQDDNTLKLWYKQPAGAWTQALPVGNGRLAAMVFGVVRKPR
jgi:hypothetical protein